MAAGQQAASLTCTVVACTECTTTHKYCGNCSYVMSDMFWMISSSHILTGSVCETVPAYSCVSADGQSE